MRRLPTTLVFGRRLIGPVLAALIVLTLAGLAMPSRADAGVRFGVRVDMPRIGVRIGSGPHGGVLIAGRYHRPHGHGIELARVDRRIARTLARQTHIRQRVMLDLRRSGYSWREIGRILDIPRPMIRRVVSQLGQPGHCRGPGYGLDDRHHGHRGVHDRVHVECGRACCR